MKRPYRRFLLIFALPVVLLLPAGLANWQFLSNTGELTDISSIAREQQKSGALYGTALHANVYAYKLEIYRARKPEIVAIGSSRVLQFRQSHFSHPFANLGRTVNYPGEAVKLVQDMLAISVPDIVIFGIDHYWLNPAFTTARDFRTHENRGGDLTPDALMTPFRWLIDGRIGWDTYVGLLGGDVPAAQDGEPLIGLRAILDGAGFAPDGSWHYDHIIFGRRPPEDPRFADTLRRIATGSAQFRHGERIDLSRVAELEEAIRLLKEAGATVVTLVPPMAARIVSEMQNRDPAYRYADAARRAIAMLDAPHGDYLAPERAGIHECEFVDGFHVGDVGAARVLRSLRDETGGILDDALDLAEVERIIAEGAGHATADGRFRRTGERELDFLQIGCEKRP